MTAIDFSVVVPFFDAVQFNNRCVSALLSQAYPADRFDIFLADNVSDGIRRQNSGGHVVKENQPPRRTGISFTMGNSLSNTRSFTSPATTELSGIVSRWDARM